MFQSDLKKRMLSGQNLVGGWLSLPSELLVEFYAQAGVDYLVIDSEHAIIEGPVLQRIVRESQSNALPILVRVAELNAAYIKKILDYGVDGLIIPNVRDLVHLEEAYSMMNYPPQGIRGVGINRGQDYGSSFMEYMNSKVPNLVLIGQIESKEAIKNLGEICTMKFLDSLIIGPYDLSTSLGTPGDFQNKIFQEALNKFEQVCRTCKMPMGFHVISSNPVDSIQKYELGYSNIIYSIDFKIFKDTIESAIKRIRLSI